MRVVAASLDVPVDLRGSAVEWMINSYYTDRMTEPPPVLVASRFLALPDAIRVGKAAVLQGLDHCPLPLGWADERIHRLSSVKLSNQVFKTPRQYRAYRRHIDRFREKYGHNLEVLTMRRGFGGRETGSMEALFGRLYALIRAGETDLSGTLQLRRMSRHLQSVVECRQHEAKHRIQEAWQSLRTRLTQATRRDEDPTGIRVAWLLE